MKGGGGELELGLRNRCHSQLRSKAKSRVKEMRRGSSFVRASREGRAEERGREGGREEKGERTSQKGEEVVVDERKKVETRLSFGTQS